MFLDETGSISHDRFFAIGILKCSEPSSLLRQVQHLRDQTHWYKEIKFSSVTTGTLGFYKRVVDTCLVPGRAQFFASWLIVKRRIPLSGSVLSGMPTASWLSSWLWQASVPTSWQP